jgi:hypothetical protein
MVKHILSDTVKLIYGRLIKPRDWLDGIVLFNDNFYKCGQHP